MHLISLENIKLLGLGKNHAEKKRSIKEVKKEVKAFYMELPTDKYGEPIHVGDVLFDENNREYCVFWVNYNSFVDEYGHVFDAKKMSHEHPHAVDVKPCRICGETPTIELHVWCDGSKHWDVSCPDCHIGFEHKTRQLAIKGWNNGRAG